MCCVYKCMCVCDRALHLLLVVFVYFVDKRRSKWEKICVLREVYKKKSGNFKLSITKYQQSSNINYQCFKQQDA